jgi:uncharacterized coiled-coil DUF342 family protein
MRDFDEIADAADNLRKAKKENPDTFDELWAIIHKVERGEELTAEEIQKVVAFVTK